MSEKKSIYKIGTCDYCCDENVMIRPTPFMCDITHGAMMCGKCWKDTSEEYAASEGTYIGKFEDGTGYAEVAKDINFSWIKLEIPKSRKSLKNRKKEEVYSEIEHVLVYEGFGILRGEVYTVTVITDCEGKGKKIASCRTLIGAYTLIKMINTFYPQVNELLAKNEMQKSFQCVIRARNATAEILGQTCWQEEIF